MPKKNHEKRVRCSHETRGCAAAQQYAVHYVAPCVVDNNIAIAIYGDYAWPTLLGIFFDRVRYYDEWGRYHDWQEKADVLMRRHEVYGIEERGGRVVDAEYVAAVKGVVMDLDVYIYTKNVKVALNSELVTVIEVRNRNEYVRKHGIASFEEYARRHIIKAFKVIATYMRHALTPKQLRHQFEWLATQWGFSGILCEDEKR
jgi:hypothetical protein